MTNKEFQKVLRKFDKDTQYWNHKRDKIVTQSVLDEPSVTCTIIRSSQTSPTTFVDMIGNKVDSKVEDRIEKISELQQRAKKEAVKVLVPDSTKLYKEPLHIHDSTRTLQFTKIPTKTYSPHKDKILSLIPFMEASEIAEWVEVLDWYDNIINTKDN